MCRCEHSEAHADPPTRCAWCDECCSAWFGLIAFHLYEFGTEHFANLTVLTWKFNDGDITEGKKWRPQRPNGSGLIQIRSAARARHCTSPAWKPSWSRTLTSDMRHGCWPGRREWDQYWLIGQIELTLHFVEDIGI